MDLIGRCHRRSYRWWKAIDRLVEQVSSNIWAYINNPHIQFVLWFKRFWCGFQR